MIFGWFGRKSTPTASKVPAASEKSPAVTRPAVAPSIDELIDLGMLRMGERRQNEALAAFDGILAQDPRNLVALYQRANAHYSRNDFDSARRAVDAALAVLPDQPDLLMLAGAIAGTSHDPAGALERFERARTVNPELVGIDERIGEQLAFLGRGIDAIAAYDRAIARDPDNFPLGSNRLFLLNHFGLFDRARTFEEHRRWGERLERAVASRRTPHANDRSPDRALRIGLVSADLRNHPVAYWLEGYLAAHDRERYPIVAIDVSPYDEDAVTARLRGRCDEWHRCGNLDADALAKLVRDLRIDVLVDLSGHTGHNRLAVFARKPAPVQVSWFGYMQTTGLATIDWRLTDAQHDPPGAQPYYTEGLWYLPGVACFMPDPDSPDPGPPPFERNGHVTFASANNWAKVTDPVKDAWAAILRATPTARLKVIARGGDEERVRRAIRDEFSRRGVDAARIDVSPFVPLKQFLAFFRDVDVALDPFPYGGGTTTLHTLWMGVPIVAVEGDTELARATPAALRGTGLGDFVACSVDEYVAIATRLAAHPGTLAGIRAALRDRLRASAAQDYAGFARTVEDAFRGMWVKVCATPTAASTTSTSPPRA